MSELRRLEWREIGVTKHGDVYTKGRDGWVGPDGNPEFGPEEYMLWLDDREEWVTEWEFDFSYDGRRVDRVFYPERIEWSPIRW